MALFDIVILEKGNAGGGVPAGKPVMASQATTDGMRFLETIDIHTRILGSGMCVGSRYLIRIRFNQAFQWLSSCWDQSEVNST